MSKIERSKNDFLFFHVVLYSEILISNILMIISIHISYEYNVLINNGHDEMMI